MVYADKGYSGEERKEYLEARGIYCGVMEKEKRGQRLDMWQGKRNKRISKIRGAVERCFGILKEHYRYVRVKYGGLKLKVRLWREESVSILPITFDLFFK